MYNVVFRTKRGGIFWTSYQSKEEFEKIRDTWTKERKENEKVSREGLTDQECLKIMNKIPPVHGVY